MKQFLLKTWLMLVCLIMGAGTMWADNFSTTYSYGLSGWRLTNYTDQSSYYQVPSGNDPSVATISDIFSGKTITSNVVVTINCATYGSGTNPSASTFSLYKETACTNAITAAQGGTLPTSSTYTDVTYTITQANAASLGDDLAIKITKPGKTIRLKSIKVEFTYTGGTKYTVNVANDIANGTVTADPTSAAAGATVTLTATPSTGYEFGSWNVTDASSNAITVTNNKFTMPASDVNVSATFNKDAGTTYNFADMTDFSSWGTSYEKKTTTFSDGAYVELASANKSTSTVTDCPITKGGDVIFKAPTGKKISSLTFTCTQWSTKAQTITLNTSINGTDYTATSTTSSNFILSASDLTNVSAVKFTFSSASNQVGIKSIKVTYADDGGDTSEKTITALEVSGTPTKTTYNVGDAFETAGLVVTATYSDDTQEVISTGFEWEIDYGTGNEALVAGATSVDVMAYTENQEVMSNVYTVNGLTVTVPVTLTSIAVSGTPTKTEYYAGDAFETAGLVVTGTYSDSHQETITEGIEWTVDPETLTLETTSVDVMASVGEVDSEVFTVNDLTVTKAPFETVTYNFSSFVSGTSVELIDLDGFTITLKGNGGTNPAWNSNQARVYAKGSLTVRANNATIKSIEYSYVVNANNKGTTPTIDGVEGTTNAGTWDVENKTWTGADEEVTFSTSGSAGNIGFTKLIIKYVESNKITPTLSFSAPTAEVTIGADNNVFPTLTSTPADLEGVTYESSNTDVATIDENTGAITLVAAGETTITANYAGNEDYSAATPASYTLTVVKAPFVPTPAPEGYEAVDFAALYSSVTTNATVEDYEGTSFAMAFAKPDGSSTPTKYYNTGKSVRAYTGNTITITAAEDIKYVDIAWSEEKGEDTGVSITGLGTTTAVVTFSNTCSFTKVTVSYKGSNSTLVATDGESYYATFSSEKNIVFANATAYTVSVADDKLTLTEVARNKVPADNAVLIKSETANVGYYFVDGDEKFEGNMLKACPNTGIFKEGADGNYYYKLAYGDNTNKTKLGFWWGAEDGSGNFNVKAGGAVLVVPQSAGSNLRGFSFREDLPTGIDSINNTTNGEIYNLQGQRINRIQQGVNIVNGKKVLR